jgi:hypothetical protein
MSEWVTVQPSLDPILAPVNAVLATIDGVLSALLAILNIVQTILNIIKAFLLGLLNPLKAIIKAIIQEIRNIINDLKQLGFYAHVGDIRLIGQGVATQFVDVRGGFQGFERRMIGRLTDKKDFNRPNFSSSSAALAGFFYVSGQDVDLILRTLTQIYNLFFNRQEPVPGAFPQPASLSVSYGGTDLASFSDLGKVLGGGGSVPQKAMLKWRMPAGPGPGSGFKMPVPKGWLIEVSTNAGGMRVVGSAPLDRNSPSLYPDTVSSVAIDPVTNGILNVYGATDMVGDGTAEWSLLWPPNPTDPRAAKLFFQKDTVTPLIPPKALSKENDGPWIGAAYYVHNNPILSAAMPGQEFNAVFDVAMLPKGADIEQDSTNEYGVKITERKPDSYFFRVRAVAKSVDEAFGKQGTPREPHPVTDEDLRLFTFTPASVRQAVSGRLVPSVPSSSVGPSDFGVASGAIEVVFPGENSVEYLQALQLALLVMMLSRSDCSGPDPGSAFSDDPLFNVGTVLGTTGLEEVARKLTKLMKVGPNFYSRDTKDWNKNIYQKTLAYAQQLFETASLSETLMAMVVELAEPLFTTKWSDIDYDFNGKKGPPITIAQTFGIGNEEYNSMTPKKIRSSIYLGAASNASTIPLESVEYQGSVDFFTVNGGPARAPGFMEDALASTTPAQWLYNLGSLDSGAPVIYQLNNDGSTVEFAAFARNLFLTKPELVTAAAAVLKVTAQVRNPRSGNWVAYRPFYEMLAPLDQILTNIENWLLALLEALDGIIEQIVAFIEAVQARIYQIQALIEWIRSLLKSLDFDLPSASGLVIVSNGTDGIIQDFVMAENKPSDSPADLGAGIVVVAGGVPNLLLELVGALMSGGGE